jgi:hypothetical protein
MRSWSVSVAGVAWGFSFLNLKFSQFVASAEHGDTARACEVDALRRSVPSRAISSDPRPRRLRST